MKNNKNILFYSLVTIFMIAVISITWMPFGSVFFSQFGIEDHYDMMHSDHAQMSVDNHRQAYLEHRNQIVGQLINEEDYACCLKSPCSYCIEKSPGHGEGASCRCLDDVMNGKHPCGECIGEILEGHGNEYIAKYFASAIADELGQDHLDTIKQIISEKYGITIKEQI